MRNAGWKPHFTYPGYAPGACEYLDMYFIYYVMNILQFLGCVAPNVSYHIPRVRGMIQGVAVRLHQFLEFLDKRGIPHRSEKSVRKKVKRNRRVGARMKQHFLKKGVVVSSKLRLKRIRRSLTTCKGCICFPKDELSSFMRAFEKGILITSWTKHYNYHHMQRGKQMPILVATVRR